MPPGKTRIAKTINKGSTGKTTIHSQDGSFNSAAAKENQWKGDKNGISEHNYSEADDKGLNGHFYSTEGFYMGVVDKAKNTGTANDVYACNNASLPTSGSSAAHVEKAAGRTKLKITHDDFQKVCNIVKHEGLSTDENEYIYIAHANYNEGKDKNTTMLARLMTSYSSVSAADKRTPLSDKAMDTISRYTRKGVIDALLRDVDSSKADPTDGARFWDGVDLLAWGIDTELKPDSSTKTGHNKFDEYDFVKIRKDLYDKFVSNIQKKYPNGAPYRPSNGHNPANDKGTHIHKQTANGPREVYSIPAQDFSRSAYWTTGDFYYKNKIKQRTGIQATKVAGYSIFWKEIK